jgi:exopolysaccharide production protein ExoZ
MAAIAVVIHHNFWIMRERLGAAGWSGSFQIGSTGVDIFFVISGFVMALSVSSSRPSPYEFIQNRIVRIVPLYWVATAIVAILSFAGLMVIGCPQISWHRILSSLAFLPLQGSGGSISDPVLFVGWSLKYEMMFYVGFALSLLLPRATSLPIMMIAILGSWLWQISSASPAAQYLGADIVLAFAEGIGLYFIPRSVIASKRMVISGLLAGGLLMATIDLPDFRPAEHPHILVILGASLIVGSAIIGENAGLAVRRGVMTRLGDASYALYLFHPLVLQILMKIWLVLHLQNGMIGLCAFVPLAIIASCLSADMIYRYVERPMLRALKRRKAALPRQEVDIGPIASGSIHVVPIPNP